MSGRGSLVALIGPTASGKSAIAMEVAKQVGAHIVAIDAFTIYRGMDIGTAKPTKKEQAEVPHHMIDLLDPKEDGTVAWFQQVARETINNLLEQGEKVLCVGGSGLYAKAVLDVMHFPPTDEKVRARIAERVEDDPRKAHAQLAQIDAEAAEKIEPDNARRTTRALEVIELTGNKFSSYATDFDSHESVFDNLQIFGLEIDRETLRDRIAARTVVMLENGWKEECAALLERELSKTAKQAHGYKEIMAAIKGEITMAEAIEQTINRTRQYGARQQRWFGRDPRIKWIGANKIIPHLLEAFS